MKMLDHRCLGDEVVVVCAEGVKNISVLIKRLVQPPGGLRSVTVVADADQNPARRREEMWDSLPIADTARASGKANGSAVADSIRYAVWLSPDNSRCGRIEDLVLDTIHPDIVKKICRLWRCKSRRTKNAEPSAKAIVAIWIAWDQNAGVGLRTAFERGLIDLKHPAFAPLRKLVDEQLS